MGAARGTRSDVPTHSRVPRGVVAGYAAGSVGTGGYGVLPGLVLAYYLTDTLGVAAAWASLVVIVPKIADVVIDPWIGAVSDRVARRRGTRTSVMLAGSITLPVLFVATFAAPVTGTGGAVWVLTFFLLAAVGFSLFQVPYIALPAELTDRYHERTRLVTVRVAVLALTILAVGAGGPAIRDLVGGRPGYLVMAVVIGSVICAGMLWASLGSARRARPPVRLPAATSLRDAYGDGVRALRDVRDFRALVVVFATQALAAAIMLAGAQYVATYVLGDESALTLLFVALVAPALLVMPWWYRFARHRGKVTALVLASSLFGLAAATLTFAVWSPGAWIYAAVAVAGLGYAGMQAFPLAMLPDVIEADARRRGAERGGVLAGVWTATETVGLAFGPAVFLAVLASTGFVSSGAGEQVTQSDTAVAGIALGFSILPAVLVALSLLALRGYHQREPGPDEDGHDEHGPDEDGHDEHGHDDHGHEEPEREYTE
ncbi:MFS transporter [Rhodococcus triatomae]|uniref:Na+/melibiose symporter n=1 Tax=Rhodococcus triatomae TaxID=300028 RepID=A0A1G8CVT8_9NOCA|nr:MFS transporter [Rhodococcus triatomae]QNG18567.1 MFS transporter [Rhodococcus triatomae]QNG21764.1 MFS transporter [Rhodococcus triatomae]SDH49598.1 Na+/melibiose symporter [Rhodococcus triatomae]